VKRRPQAPDDEHFMRLALDEARKGLGRTAPNPVVGAVLVKNGKVLATGFHQKAGSPHAEVNCLRAVRKGMAKGADLYTTLEPCNHFGRTPPCSQAVLEAGVKRVICGSPDPNPLVNGKGVARLRAAGVEVVEGVLRDEADALNRPFFKFIQKKLPYVTLKAAVSLDGKLATVTGDSRWVTGEPARQRVHRLRNEVDAILVGANTVRTDSPKLTTRIHGGRDALRVVVDSRLSLAPGLEIFTQKSAAKTIVATTLPPDSRKAARFRSTGTEVWSLPSRNGRVDLKALLEALSQRGCLHVLVEGGAEVFGSLVSEGLADELWLFLAPKLVGKTGISWVGELGIREMSSALPLKQVSFEQVGSDLLLVGQFEARTPVRSGPRKVRGRAKLHKS